MNLELDIKLYLNILFTYYLLTNLYIKRASNHKNNIKNEFLDPKLVLKKHVSSGTLFFTCQ